MTIENEPEVKDVEWIEIAPAPEGDETVEVGDTTPESSQDNEGSDDDSKKPDELVKQAPPAGKVDDGLADVENETPKERAQRLEITRLRGKLRQERGQEIFEPQAQSSEKKELSPEKAAILGKYKAEEISSLREVFPVIAEEMGFINKNELQGATYHDKAQEALDTFLEKHPEYTSENDKDGLLWNAFKGEYSLYKQPANPKDFPKIFERIHKDVFGIKPTGDLKTVNAQVEKTKVASHAGSSSANNAPPKRATAAKEGLRLDMLKGFSDEEKAELTD